MPRIITVNERDEVVGSATSREEAVEQGLFRRIIRVFLFDENGRMLIQKRSMTVDSPLHFDQAVGGHVDEGESYDEAAYRELTEELGVSGFLLTRVTTGLKERDVFCSIYMAEIYSGLTFNFDTQEVESLHWFSPTELDVLLQDNATLCTDGLLTIWPLFKDAILSHIGKHRRVTIVNEKNEIVGYEPYMVAREKRLLRSFAVVFVCDTTGRHLLQRRSRFVSTPLLYDIAAGGHTEEGMTPRETAEKELAEELGIHAKNLKLVVEAFRVETSIGDAYSVTVSADTQIMFDPTEVASVHWFTTEEIDTLILEQPEQFTHHFVSFWNTFRDTITTS